MFKQLVRLSLVIFALLIVTGAVYAIPLPPTGTITPSTAALIGSNADDRIGSEGIYALPSGNIVIASRYWNSGRGAVTCLTPAEYTAGGIVVSETNSLTGGAAGNEVGLAITVLKNGNYVVGSRNWDNGATLNVGAATWVDGKTCLPFGETSKGVTVSATNSLIGSTANDQVGNATYTLANGNYLVTSSSWDNGGILNAGAVTWVNGATGLAGAVSAANSLVGSTASDGIGGRTPIELKNGNVVISAESWDNPVGPITDVGAAIWMNGTTGKTGTISASNAMIGAVANDYFGLSGVTALANGNYVVGSRFFNNAGVAAGAITWGNGVTGTVGVADITNSLLGSTNGDFIGHIPLTALDNGSFVMRAPIWDNAGVANAGAVVWGNGTAPLTGIISAANALVGQTENDTIGETIIPLALGGFVVGSSSWDNGAILDAGAATWGSGTAPLIGTISAANSLIGSTADDKISSDGIFALTNGHYVVTSSFWDNGGTADVGAVTWGNQNGSTVGAVSQTNSLIGTSANDRVGDSLSINRSTIALNNGNYVVTSRQWDNGATTDVGAVTWVNGSAPVIGVVSATNSLIGTTAGDGVGYIDALPNGDYLVRSANWDNGAIVNAGAATLGDGVLGTVGVVNTSNSLVGVTAEDRVGQFNLQPILANGNYLVVTGTWNDGLGGIAIGAVTWCDTVTGCAGETVSAANSIVGSQNADLSDISVITYPNGDYMLVAKLWDNGGQANVGALIYGDGTRKTTLVISDRTALVGVSAGDNLGAKYAILPDYGIVIGASGWDDGATLNVGAVVYIDPPINRLQNASYEIAGSPAKYAANWKLSATAMAGDKRICDKPLKPLIRTNGNCVFQFNANQTPLKTRTLKQIFNTPDWANVGDVLTLTADVEGLKVSGSTRKIILNIKYDNNTTDRATLSIPAGTYDYQTLVGTVKLTRVVKKVVVTLNVGTAKGRIRIDNLTLRDSSPAALRFPALGENTTRDGASPFTLPVAPDGFRK